MKPEVSIDVTVVGAGPAGLATSYLLKRRGLDHVVLVRGDRPAFVWANLYDSLRLHTGRHMSSLPGKSMRVLDLFLTREAFVRYLHDYARDFDLPIRTGTEVNEVRREGEDWILGTNEAPVRTKALVIASGLVSNPYIPQFESQHQYVGQILHSSAYRRPSDLGGKRVLGVGIGNSGAEIASELGGAGYEVDIDIRSGANVVPLQIAGIPVQYLSFWVRKLPSASGRNPLSEYLLQRAKACACKCPNSRTNLDALNCTATVVAITAPASVAQIAASSRPGRATARLRRRRSSLYLCLTSSVLQLSPLCAEEPSKHSSQRVPQCLNLFSSHPPRNSDVVVNINRAIGPPDWGWVNA